MVTKKSKSTKAVPRRLSARTRTAAPVLAEVPVPARRRRGLWVAGIAALVLAGLVVQTWVMARARAAQTFDLVRLGAPIQKGLEDGQLMGALAMGTDGDGNLYVLDQTDAEDGRLQKFNSANGFLIRYKSARASEALINCRELAVSKDGEVGVLRKDGTVLLLDKALRFQASFNASAGTVGGIAIDPKGRILVSSVDANKVIIFDASGHKTGEFGAPGTHSGDLSAPLRLRFLADGRLVVMESTPTGPRLKVFSPTLALERSFALSGVGAGDFNELGVNVDGLAFINDPVGTEGVVVYNLGTGRFVGNTKGTTAGDLFVNPGAVGADTYGKAVVVGTITGYYKCIIGPKGK